MDPVVYKDESYRVIGACFEVYKQKGCGFSEEVYQQCLAIEFRLQKIPFVSKPTLELAYKGELLEKRLQPDFICFDKIIVELKALTKLLDVSRAQALNYLTATGFELALLINFGHYPKLEYERIVNRQKRRGSLRDEMRSWLE